MSRNPMIRFLKDNGIKVVTDLRSFLYLCNTTLEFSHNGPNGKGFYFNNPNASRHAVVEKVLLCNRCGNTYHFRNFDKGKGLSLPAFSHYIKRVLSIVSVIWLCVCRRNCPCSHKGLICEHFCWLVGPNQFFRRSLWIAGSGLLFHPVWWWYPLHNFHLWIRFLKGLSSGTCARRW